MDDRGLGSYVNCQILPNKLFLTQHVGSKSLLNSDTQTSEVLKPRRFFCQECPAISTHPWGSPRLVSTPELRRHTIQKQPEKDLRLILLLLPSPDGEEVLQALLLDVAGEADSGTCFIAVQEEIGCSARICRWSNVGSVMNFVAGCTGHNLAIAIVKQRVRDFFSGEV